MANKIDFVVLWVDSSDEEWQKEKNKYLELENKTEIDITEKRYRNYGTLKYWFRGVAKYASWVNRIHFITCGHLPSWLDTSNPKLHIVKHSDYMPKDALPTFNSNAIELMIHKIEGLQENFVLFNDDMFIMNTVKENDFFKNGLPCNSMALAPVIPYTDQNFYKTLSNNVEIINTHFVFNECLKNNILKYLSLKQGKHFAKTLPLLVYGKFPGFVNFHLPISYLKSTFEEVWNKEEELLKQTVYSKFRKNEKNISNWVFNYWQFANGKFYQRNCNSGLNININDKNASELIKKQKYKILGLADSGKVVNFEDLKTSINEAFDKIFPDKCEFEK